MTHNKTDDILCHVEPIKTGSQLIKRDACEVINAPCSFGRVCLVESSFCPRKTSQLKNVLHSSTPLPTGGRFAFGSTRLVICSQSSTKENCE